MSIAILSSFLTGYAEEDEWPSDHIIKDNLTGWNTNLTVTVSEELGEDFNKFIDEATNHYGNAGNLKKNPLLIGKALELAWNGDVKSTILNDLVQRIIAFAEANSST